MVRNFSTQWHKCNILGLNYQNNSYISCVYELTRKVVLAFLATLFFSFPSFCQERSAGFLSSFTGVGVCFDFPSSQSGWMHTFDVCMDTYGHVTGRTSDLGVLVAYSYENFFFAIDRGEYLISFHGGAGLAGGYVHDYESGIFRTDEDRTLNKEQGAIASLRCSIGVRFDFERNISIDFRLSALPGIHIRKDHDTGVMFISPYKRGIYHALFPHLGLMYRF